MFHRPEAALILFAVTALACGSGDRPRLPPNPLPSRLADGAYRCDATNTTRGNGPLPANCGKSGNTITVRFPKRDSIAVDLDVHSQSSNAVSWELEGQDTRTGDLWDIVVER